MTDKVFFRDDYSVLTHPRFIDALAKMAGDFNHTYGADDHCARVRDIIRQACQAPGADIHFLTVGTATNIMAISHALRPYESVIACDTAHILTREAGAIEACGHKIHYVPHDHGKLTPDAILRVVQSQFSELHNVPKLVYIAQASEMGTIYSLQELRDIAQTCRANDLYLYIDGARMFHALCSHAADFTLADLAGLADMLYLGATKNGAMMGEALIIPNDALKPYMKHTIRQRGGLLAKGALLGVQFETLFKDEFYRELAGHANQQAQKIAKIIQDSGFDLAYEVQANLVFATMPRHIVTALQDHVIFGYGFDDQIHSDTPIMRFVASWSTSDQDLDRLAQSLTQILV